MSISKKDISVIIVSFKSDHVIHKCIKSIDKSIDILVVDNSNNYEFKKNVEQKYKNVKCILSNNNIGMGAGNNLAIKNLKKKFALILNPDVLLKKNTIKEIIEASKNIKSFAILAPISDQKENLNYKLENNEIDKVDESSPFKVKSVDGFAMLLNIKKLKKIKNFNFFDENFFLYLENDDLCKRIIDYKENIYVIPRSKIKHLGGKAVNPKYKNEIEFSRNWHWMWSKFYYNKKHFGFFVAFINGFPIFLKANFKFLFYLFLNKPKKKQIYLQRVLGFVSALLGKKSFYRPKI